MNLIDIMDLIDSLRKGEKKEGDKKEKRGEKRKIEKK